MPERSFGRTIRYRRTKLGLSQARLGELVGRSASTVRTWEKDSGVPDDPGVIESLSAVLGLDPALLYSKAGVEPPSDEGAPTVEQALASLSPLARIEDEEVVEKDLTADREDSDDVASEETALATPSPQVTQTPVAAYKAPPAPYVITPPTPSVEPSYIEDRSQRQLYRVRNLATVVLLVGLAVVLLWALSTTFTAVGDWWDDFFGQLRL